MVTGEEIHTSSIRNVRIQISQRRKRIPRDSLNNLSTTIALVEDVTIRNFPLDGIDKDNSKTGEIPNNDWLTQQHESNKSIASKLILRQFHK